MLKRFGILLLIIVCLLSGLTSCGQLVRILFSPIGGFQTVYRQGLDEYAYGDLDYSLSEIIPIGMLTKFKYEAGDYHGYLQAGSEKYSPWPFGKTFMYLRYDDSVYEIAKEYMKEHAFNDYVIHLDPVPPLEERIVYAENGYVIYASPLTGFWFGFNDELRTIYSFGLYNSDYPTDITSTGETYAARAIALYEKEGFAGFLREYYSEYYDFGI